MDTAGGQPISEVSMKGNILVMVAALVAGAMAFSVGANDGSGSGATPVADAPGSEYVNASNQFANSDEQWACELAMCLSNPAGPTAVRECVAPVQKMHRALAKGKVIPKCKFLAGGSSGGGGPPGGGGDDRDREAQRVK